MCWSRWAVRRAGLMYNLHRKGGPAGGVPVASPMTKSIFFLRKGKGLTVASFVIAYLSLVELRGIYHG